MADDKIITEKIDYSTVSELSEAHKMWLADQKAKRSSMDMATSIPNLYRAWLAGEGLVIDDRRDEVEYEYPSEADYRIPVTRVEQLSPEHLEGWYKALHQSGWAASTIINYHGILKGWHKWMVKKDLISYDYTEKADPTDLADIERNSSKLADYFKAEHGVIHAKPWEVKEMCKRENLPESKLESELVIRLLFSTGCREKELRHIKLTDLTEYQPGDQPPDKDRIPYAIWMTTAKNGDLRFVKYDPKLQPLLDRWIEVERSYIYGSEDSDYLFPTKYNEKMARNTPNKIVKRAAENAGIQDYAPPDAAGRRRRRITCHALRRGFAVACIKNGMDIRTLQRLLGHRRLEQTKIYLRFSDKDVQQGYDQYGPHRS